MNISIDALPLIGRAGGKAYTSNLISSLIKYDKNNFYNLVFRKYNLNLNQINNEYKSENLKISKIIVPNRILEYLWTFNDFKIYADFLYKYPDLYLTSTYFIPNFKLAKVVSILYDITTLKIEKYFKHKEEFLIRMNNIIKKSSKIIAISEYTKFDFCDYFKLNPNKVDVIYPCVSDIYKVIEDEKVEKFLRNKGLSFRKYFLYVGNISYHKNISNLIDSFLKLKQKDIKLVLCGSTKWGEEIIDKIKIENIQDKVLIFENLSDQELCYFYNGCLAFCYISLYEGFGLPVLEAMKCSRPVIVSNRTSLPEVVGDCGIKVDPLSIGDISEKMNFLIDKQNNIVYSQKSKKRADFFSSKKMVESFINVFKDLA